MRAGEDRGCPLEGKRGMMASASGIKRWIALCQCVERELEPHLDLDQGSAIARDRIEKIVEQLACFQIAGVQSLETGRLLIGASVGKGLQHA